MNSAFLNKVNRIDYGSSTTCTADCQCAQLTSYTTGNAYVRLNMRCTTTCVQCNPGVACTTYSCSSNCRCPTDMYWTNMAMGCRMEILFFNSFYILKIIKLFKFLQEYQVGYGQPCTTTAMCKLSLALVCSTSNDQCYCPTSMAMDYCDCLVTQYYAGDSVGCSNFEISLVFFIEIYI